MSIRHAMLALLSEGPKYGLRLREEFEARTGDIWPLNAGQVYTTLQRLERDGLIAPAPPPASASTSTSTSTSSPSSSSRAGAGDDDGTQKLYIITGEGAAELARWLRTPPDLSSPPRDELVMKILVALRVPGTDVRDVIQAHRRYLVELMQQWTRIKEDDAGEDLSMSLAVDAELFRLDSVVRWLDAAEARIRRAAAEGPATSRKTQSRAPLPRHRREARAPR